MPVSMTDARDAAFHRFATACQEDARIQAAFLGGSGATGRADAYSDLDLYVLVADEDYLRFFADRDDFLRRLGEPVFREDFNGFGFDMLIFILADGVDGELVLERSSRADSLQSGPFIPVLDRGDILRERAFPIRVPSSTDRTDVLRMALGWFWRDIMQISRAIARGQLWSAYGYLEEMRHKCVDLLTLAQDPDGGPSDHFLPVDGFAVLERVTNEEDLARLRSSFGPLERDSLIAAAHALIAIYQRLAPPLAVRYGLTYPNQLAALALKRLNALAEAGPY